MILDQIINCRAISGKTGYHVGLADDDLSVQDVIISVVAMVDDKGKLEGLAPGKTSVTACADNGVKDSAEIVVTIEGDNEDYGEFGQLIREGICLRGSFKVVDGDECPEGATSLHVPVEAVGRTGRTACMRLVDTKVFAVNIGSIGRGHL